MMVIKHLWINVILLNLAADENYEKGDKRDAQTEEVWHVVQPVRLLF